MEVRRRGPQRRISALAQALTVLLIQAAHRRNDRAGFSNKPVGNARAETRRIQCQNAGAHLRLPGHCHVPPQSQGLHS